MFGPGVERLFGKHRLSSLFSLSKLLRKYSPSAISVRWPRPSLNFTFLDQIIAPISGIKTL
jgi:hypothetical protein